jgi:hypothetical protein
MSSIAAGVRFIVVGGAAAVIHGAPITTQDLDIVPDQSSDGIDRLADALVRLDACFRPVLPDATSRRRESTSRAARS